MKAFRRIISAVVALVLVMSVSLVAPPTASAAPSQIKAPLNFFDAITVDTNKLSSEGWKWVQSTKTLTLDGLNLNCDKAYDFHPAVILPGGSTIEVKGSNSIRNSYTDGGGTGIRAYGALTIKGSGTLKAYTNNGTGIAASGNITISGATLSIVANMEEGITADPGGVAINNGANVKISTSYSGISARDGNVSVSGSSTVLDIETYSSGIVATATTLDSRVAVSISGGSLKIDASESGIFVNSGSVTFSGGSGTIKADRQNKAVKVDYFAVYVNSKLVVDKGLFVKGWKGSSYTQASTIATFPVEFGGSYQTFAAAAAPKEKLLNIEFGKAVKVTGVKTQKTLYIAKSQTAKLTAAVRPQNASNKGVTWKSSNSKIATVNKTTGSVKGLNVGKTTITATTNDGKKAATCTVHVVGKKAKLTSLSLTPAKTCSARTNTTLQVKTKLTPSKATGIVLTYSSSNAKVATVDNTGLVTALTPGKAIITVKAGTKTSKLTVNVE